MQLLFKRIKALPFVPKPNEVWKTVKLKSPKQAGDLFKYMDNTWFSMYETTTWNYYKLVIPRTNNHVESWNNRISSFASESHPNVYKLVQILKMDELFTRKENIVAITKSSKQFSKITI